MKKTLIIALAAASIAAVPAFAADNSSGTSTDKSPEMKTESQMNPTAAPGAQPDQKPGAPTSNRSNEPTPVPNAQVDKAPSGETSDRTPEKHTK
jgi:hypothetical protein